MITEENFDITLCKGRPSKKNPNNYTINDLKEFLKEKNLSMNGNKQDLCNRIETYIDKKKPKMHLIDCGAGGNCLFHVISTIINSLHKKYKFTAKDVRKMTAKSISEENIDSILETYSIDYKNNEYDFQWDPIKLKGKYSSVKKTRIMKKIVKTEGFLYEGDLLSIDLLYKNKFMKNKKLAFVIISDSGQMVLPKTPYSPDNYGILYNMGNIHWQMVGLTRNGIKKTVFKEEDLDHLFDNFTSYELD
jgi:hypothetical protein